MPELPEVEVSIRYLKPLLVGRTIESVDELIKSTWSRSFLKSSEMIGCKILDIQRNGKYIIFILSNDLFWVIHLRMTGQVVVTECDDVDNVHERCSVFLDNKMKISFIDIRKFGVMYLNKSDTYMQNTGMFKLGFDPFLDKIDVDVLAKDLSRHGKMPVKSYLLSQTGISGVGNIYADEVLFLSKVSPLRLCSGISSCELNSLIENIKSILSESINYGGSTIYTFKSSSGKSGSFQEYLKVYGRKNEKCTICNFVLIGCKIGGRSTVYCNKCQS